MGWGSWCRVPRTPIRASPASKPSAPTPAPTDIPVPTPTPPRLSCLDADLDYEYSYWHDPQAYTPDYRGYWLISNTTTFNRMAANDGWLDVSRSSNYPTPPAQMYYSNGELNVNCVDAAPPTTAGPTPPPTTAGPTTNAPTTATPITTPPTAAPTVAPVPAPSRSPTHSDVHALCHAAEGHLLRPGAASTQCVGGACDLTVGSIDHAACCVERATCGNAQGESSAGAVSAADCGAGFEPGPSGRTATLRCASAVCAAGPSGADHALCCQPIDDCAPSPCADGGTCVDAHLGYSCVCPTGLVGSRCEHRDVTSCSASGRATIVAGSLLCICAHGYTGSSCQFLVTTTSAPTVPPTSSNPTQGSEGPEQTGTQTDNPGEDDSGRIPIVAIVVPVCLILLCGLVALGVYRRRADAGAGNPTHEDGPAIGLKGERALDNPAYAAFGFEAGSAGNGRDSGAP